MFMFGPLVAFVSIAFLELKLPFPELYRVANLNSIWIGAVTFALGASLTNLELNG